MSTETAIAHARSLLSAQAKDVGLLLQQVADTCALVAERIEADRIERHAFVEAIGRSAQSPGALESGEHPLGGTVFPASEIAEDANPPNHPGPKIPRRTGPSTCEPTRARSASHAPSPAGQRSGRDPARRVRRETAGVPDRLSPIEAVMWRAGHDPSLRMTVGIVVVLDSAPSLEALEERFAAVIKRSPRLQLRPGGESFGHATPSWLEDGAPSASRHLRSAAVSRPGTLRQMLDLVSLLEAVPFDPDHAPWDGTLIEGLEGGRAALYLRAHHVVSDGLAGLRITGRFFDSDEIDVREEIDLRDEVMPATRPRDPASRPSI